MDGFIPLGAEILIGVFVVLRRAADHAASHAFLKEGDFAIHGDREGCFGMLGNEGFEGIPDHAGNVGIVEVFVVLCESGENGKAVFFREARGGGS